jgi:hypothetical protein
MREVIAVYMRRLRSFAPVINEDRSTATYAPARTYVRLHSRIFDRISWCTWLLRAT